APAGLRPRQFAHLAARRRLPYSQAVSVIARGEKPSVGRHGNVRHPAGATEIAEFKPSGDIPGSYAVLADAARIEYLAVRREHDLQDFRAVTEAECAGTRNRSGG